MPGYTALSVLAVAVVLLLERRWWRTGVLRTARYWQALTIIAFFMVLVDGWLTWPGRAVVVYDPAETTGLRVPWGIPVEDYGFGWAMVTATIMIWERRARREDRTPAAGTSTQDRVGHSVD